jgi:ketosteroid isomerase-like protein
MQTEHAVLAYEDRLVRAQLAGDVAELDALLADDLVYTGLSGELAGKDDDLALHRSGRFRITRMVLVERRVVDLGDTAVVISLMDTAALLDTSQLAGQLRYTRVWTRQGEGWRLSVAHLSQLAIVPQID